MKYLFTLILGFIVTGIQAQDLNKKIEDKIKHKQVMLNLCTREGLIAFPEFKDSYDTFYEAYSLDSASVAKLKPLLAGHKIKIVLGTWCGDSKLQVPHFLKVTDAASINETDIQIISVDGDKKAENGLIDGLNIERVPTFIVTDKDGAEIGRITESPRKTIEADLLELLTKKK
jgi:hypothetical protein